MENLWRLMNRVVHHFRFCKVVCRSRRAGVSDITLLTCFTWAIVLSTTNHFSCWSMCPRRHIKFWEWESDALQRNATRQGGRNAPLQGLAQ